MKFNKQGVFWIPEGYDISDLGGKAEHLIRNQDKILEAGFKMPEAVCIPWQELISIARENGIDENYEPDAFSAPNFFPLINEKQTEIMKFIQEKITNPFLSSSSPDEDSFEARMFGVYDSRQISPLHSYIEYDVDWEMYGDFFMEEVLSGDILKDPDFGKHSIPGYKEKWLDLAQKFQDKEISVEDVGKEAQIKGMSQSLSNIVASYYNPLGMGLRKKHSFEEKGMGILVRETIGKEKEDHFPSERGFKEPEYSIIARTGYKEGILISITKGLGNNIVDGKGKSDSFIYNVKEDTYRKVTNQVLFDKEEIDGVKQHEFNYYDEELLKQTGISINDLGKMLTKLKEGINFPDTHDVDFEMAVEDKDIFMLQSSPAKKVKNFKIVENENNLIDPLYVMGSVKKNINKLLILPSPFFYSKDEKQRLIWVQIAQWVSDFNKENKDYLIIGTPYLSKNDNFDLKYYYNAAGVIEFQNFRDHYHFKNPLMHYNNLIREEGMTFVVGYGINEFKSIVGEYIPQANDDGDIGCDILDGKLKPLDMIKVMDVDMTLETDEYAEKANLYFNEK
ncbi:PEP/pyruvate-binding domain-containing protein [Nanoarchaeota archaeon]